MNWTEYLEYFENLATQHKQLVDFHCGTMADVLADELGRDLPTGAFLFLERYTKGKNSPSWDEQYDVVNGALLVLKPVPERDDNEDVYKVVDAETEAIVVDVMARMKADSENCEFLDGLDLSSFRMQYVAGIFDNCHGWRLSFRIEKANGMEVDSANWEDL